MRRAFWRRQRQNRRSTSPSLQALLSPDEVTE